MPKYCRNACGKMEDHWRCCPFCGEGLFSQTKMPKIGDTVYIEGGWGDMFRCEVRAVSDQGTIIVEDFSLPIGDKERIKELHYWTTEEEYASHLR